jgi:hypothetical protein
LKLLDNYGKLNDLLSKINKLYIEWHFNKISNITLKRHLYIKNLVKNINQYDWDALEYSINKTQKDTEYLEYINII